jgi:RNA polymerase sigma-70 factor (ECF subfamily)
MSTGQPNLPHDPRSQFLAEHRPWLQLLARLEIDSRLAGKYSASDVVQQTLLEAWRDWGQFRGSDERGRKAWLRQILAHQLARLGRQFTAQKRYVNRERLAASLERSSLRLEQFFAADQTSPSQQVLAREESLELARVLEQLPADYRQVLLLRHLEELSHEQIAERMQRSVGAVRMLWLRALNELRLRMSDGTSARP